MELMRRVLASLAHAVRPRPNNVNDKADKAATMQPTSCYVTLTTSGEACLIKGQLKYI